MAPGNPPSQDRPDIATETRLARVELRVEQVDVRLVRVEVGVENLNVAVRELRADVRDIRGEMNDIRKQAREDFRILFAAIIATNLGLGSLMAKGFGWF